MQGEEFFQSGHSSASDLPPLVHLQFRHAISTEQIFRTIL